ncbi:MAG TPA: acyloxyacyl hydrolase [Rhodospirillales bacterium]|jgi:lipid A 3-O-deacylase
MKPASAGRLAVLYASALLTSVTLGVSWGTASAASIDSAYDMERMLNEPHPLANEYGTRWRPAPVQPRAPLPPRPIAAPPVMAPALTQPVAIPPPAMLPTVAPAAPPAAAPAGSQAITPNLTLDETGTPKATAAPRSPASAQAKPAPAPTAPAPPPGRTAQRTAGADKSTVRVGARSTPVRAKGDGWLSEIRIGALAHDEGPFSHKKEDGVDANVELLFASPDFLKIIWSPRPHIGGNINSSGDTSQGYFGLSWEWEFWRYMFGGFSLGGAVHTGETTNAPVDRKELGCRVLFRESVELGFRFAERHSVSAFLDHISNAKLCSTNEGLENFGVRYGYKF